MCVWFILGLRTTLVNHQDFSSLMYAALANCGFYQTRLLKTDPNKLQPMCVDKFDIDIEKNYSN